jgi:tetratricopeptide (TPR) repeat protein
MRYEVVRVDEIERRGGWIPVRERLGIDAFGVNGWIANEQGQIISPHDEKPSRHEELYVVLEGRATFTVDGEEIDAPAGTLVFVADPASERGAIGDATVLAVGGVPGEAYAVRDWEWNRRAMQHYEAERYADATAVLREGLAANPDSAPLHYNLACFAALAGETDDALAHLRRAVELRPQFRDAARDDEDLAPVRDDPRFEAALR